MLVLIEDTPNPNALKFSTVPDSAFSPVEAMYFENKEQAIGKSDFVIDLFDLGVVEAVFLGDHFVTVTVHPDSNFDQLKSEVINLVLQYLGNNVSILNESRSKNTEAPENTEAANHNSNSAIEEEIIKVIATKIKPSVAMDGGDVAYHSFVNGVVKVKLRGACSGCPSAQMTLKDGIESTLKYYIPEVEAVEAVDATD